MQKVANSNNMITNYYRGPKSLTPKMLEYKDKYIKKSKQKVDLGEDLQSCYVVEWEDGGMQYRFNETVFFITTIYFEGDGELKFDFVYNLAKELDMKEIVFMTERNPNGWLKLIKRRYPKHNPRLKGYVLGVDVKGDM